MKKKIHPKYEASTISCACGNVIETRSTKKEMRVEICSNCHPVFTGKHKMIDTEGIVDKFLAKIKASESKGKEKKEKKTRVRKQKARHDIKQILADQEANVKLRQIKKQKEEAKKAAQEATTVKVVKPAKAIAEKDEIVESEKPAKKTSKKTTKKEK